MSTSSEGPKKRGGGFPARHEGRTRYAQYSDATKLDAMLLYASGEPPVRIAERLGIDIATITRWRDKGEPRDWEAERKKVMDETAARLTDELVEKRKGLGKAHFETYDLLHRAIKNALLEPVPGEKAGTFRLRANLPPNDLQRLARAMAIVQSGQRTIFGQSTYLVEAVKSGTADGAIPDIPDDVVAMINEELAKATADPGAEIKDDD